MKLGRKVVVLSRVPSIGCLVSSVLEKDCLVVSAFSLAEARRRVAAMEPDILLYDVDMSRHFWPNTLRELMALDPFVSLVFVTNKLIPDFVALKSRRDIDGILCKPLLIADIQNTISHLSRRIPPRMSAGTIPDPVTASMS